MKPKILLSLALACGTLTTYSQDGRLSGKVYDARTEKPLAGATILLKGSGTTTTDRQGAFSIDCDGAQEITIRYDGYGDYKEQIHNCDEVLDIALNSGHTLSEIEITASSSNDKSILSQPASIAKLGLTELKRGNGLFLDDAINLNIPGVLMEKRTVSGGQQFNIRGYGNGMGPRGANNNFDGQGLKLYLNGIPVTDAEGITLLDDIDFGSIGNVEVIKGPAGSLYGLAAAGVVNLNTIQPEAGKVSLGQDILVGSYGLRRYSTRFQMGGKHASLLLTYGRQTSDGFMDQHSASRKDFINVAGSFRPNGKQDINVYFGYSNSYDQRAGELTIAQYENKDYSGNPAYIKNDAHSQIISFRAGVGHTYKFNNHIANTTSVFASGISNNSSSAAGWTDKTPVNYGIRSTLDMHYKLSSNFSLSGITGVEAQSQYAQIIGYNMVADSANLSGYNKLGSTKSNQLIFSSTTSLFTEWNLNMPYQFSLTGGIGWSTQYQRLDDRFYVAGSKKPSRYATQYNNMFSPHIALNKIFSKQVSAYISYSRGYRAPVSGNIYIPATGSINTGLVPEKADQFEIGTKGILLHSKLFYQVAWFRTKVSDKLSSFAVPLDSFTTAYSYTANSGGQENKGIEAAVSYNLFQSGNGILSTFRPFANICYSDFKYDNYQYETLNSKQSRVIADYNDKSVAGVPRITANVGIDFAMRWGIYGNISYTYRDGMPISSDGLNNTTSFNLLNTKIGVQQSLFNHLGIDVYVGADNLTGTQYYYMVFINQLPDAYLPAPSKTCLYGGVNLKYTF